MIVYALIFFAALFLISRMLRGGRPDGAESREIPVETVDGRDCLVCDGARYYAYAGVCEGETTVWEWHGRMGDGMGILTRDGAPLPVGELYCLREGDGRILLAHLPEDGWVLTDMELFVREGESLPEILPEGFVYGEIYRVEGAFSQEEWRKAGEIREPETVRELARAWLTGPDSELPEGDGNYRIRLHWGEEPGLYVSLSLREIPGGFALEKNRFRGETFLPEEVLKDFMN